MKKIIALLLASSALMAQKTNKKLVWEENFDGKTLNEKAWNYETGAGGWGNHERQTYDKTSHTIADGKLTITVKKDGDHYSSTRITTKGKKEFQYGYMEARVKLPVGHGIWPAFWMLGSNISEKGWPKGGEIDIMEYIGREPHMAYTTVHTQDTHGAHASSKKTEFPDIENGYHLFACDWNKDRIIFFVDDKPVYTYSPENKTEGNWPFDQPFFFIINCAVGGDFGGPEVDDKIFPQQYVVDYVKVYQ
ncbi:glycoside hydrolase family 16 protein [Flavobacterium sp. MAH-1]|uniref:Glycoside hydrolase family 16 protein n=1 Tax=Flavobacterium agri TaxID=2743471 RepID=A0A7Y8Y4L2_9FLAO|nr:glycoside hydrolase family 16 protein [Flavobacterium agri]NUY82226.1 glycoside hydrolase family 16 protein [Flavobacterium agri]NYA72250.1 glycoside hydrolase family 16 protein [Flavobacterium agri]